MKFAKKTLRKMIIRNIRYSILILTVLLILSLFVFIKQYRKIKSLIEEEESEMIIEAEDRHYLKGSKEFLIALKNPRADYKSISFLLEPKNICNKEDEDSIIFIVHSSLKYSERRNTLRSTLGNYGFKSAIKYKMIYVIGTHSNGSITEIEDEFSKNDDLLVLDVVDAYKNMTFKAIGWIKWMSERCKLHPKYIVKIDDDTLIKIPDFIDLLKPCFTKQLIISDPICSEFSGLVRSRDTSNRSGKYRVKIEEYPLKKYPPFIPGLLYIFPGEFINRMLIATRHVPFLWLDDVYVTAFIRTYIDIGVNDLSKYIVDTHISGYKTTKLYSTAS